jgi:hypothetical protein
LELPNASHNATREYGLGNAFSEPASVVLFGLGGLGLLIFVRRRRRMIA